MKLVKEVYVITNKFPKEELYALTNQLRRAAISVPSNIAEGNAMPSNKHFLKFLHTSLGSLYEIEVQLELAKDLGYIQEARNALSHTKEIIKMLSGLMNTLKSDFGNLKSKC